MISILNISHLHAQGDNALNILNGCSLNVNGVGVVALVGNFLGSRDQVAGKLGVGVFIVALFLVSLWLDHRVQYYSIRKLLQKPLNCVQPLGGLLNIGKMPTVFKHHQL